VNPRARLNQFADYHGHGWNFRGVFRRDREGNLLDAAGKKIDVPTAKATSPAPDPPREVSARTSRSSRGRHQQRQARST
jgi:hypothetical protein